MMIYPTTMYYHVSTLLLLIIILFVSRSAQADQTARTRNNGRISAAFVFGDSTVDSGNNNYIATAFRSNFPPYGRDFVGHISTGRFTNGKLVTDFGGNDHINLY